MSWTKRQFVTQAFEEIGYASYAYDLEPEQLQSALRRLDAMVASWAGKGILIGYPLPDTPENSDLDDETFVPDWANEAIYVNLAIKLAPTIGKQITLETKATAKSAYNVILKQAAMPNQMQFPTSLPGGAGNKTWRNDNPFMQPVDDNVVTPPNNEAEFLS